MKLAKFNVHIVRLRPNLIVITRVPRRHLKRNLILIIVRFEVTAESHKRCQITIVQGRAIWPSLCVHKHLQALVHPHVEIDVAVCRPRVAILEPANGELKRLLIQSALVRGAHIDFTQNARRGHVRHRLAVAVFLNVHRRNVEGRRRGIIWLNLLWPGKRLQVPPPLPANQLQPRKPQRHRLREPLQEHPNEPDGPEIRDATDLPIELPNRNFELIPPDRLRLPIRRLHGLHKRVRDVVPTDVVLAQILGPQ